MSYVRGKSVDGGAPRALEDQTPRPDPSLRPLHAHHFSSHNPYRTDGSHPHHHHHGLFGYAQTLGFWVRNVAEDDADPLICRVW